MPSNWAASVSVEDGALRVTSRELLFELSPSTLVGDRTTQYDVANDGRFLMLRNATAGGPEDENRMVLVRNFLEEVRSRVQTN